MKFSKYEGLGNDFIVVENVDITPAQAIALCDRRFGISADGVLQLSSSDKAPYRMIVHNSDGSIAEMCGNGLRCLVRHIGRVYPEVGAHFDVETDAGILKTAIDDEMIRVHLGCIIDEGKRTAQVTTEYSQVDACRPVILILWFLVNLARVTLRPSVQSSSGTPNFQGEPTYLLHGQRQTTTLT